MAITYLSDGGDATGDLSTFLSTNGLVSIDSTRSHTGTSSIKSDGTASAAATFTTPVCLADTGRRVSFWMYASALPALGNSSTFLTLLNSGSSIAEMCFAAGNVLQIDDQTNAHLGTHPISAGVWTRITISFTVPTFNTSVFKVYVNGVLDISTVANGMILSTGTSSLQLGFNRTALNTVLWFDDLYVDDGSDFSDPGNISVTSKFPSADSGSNGWTSLGVARASGSHYLSVSETPKNDANGWQFSAATSTEESYTVQAANVGTDVSAATIVGHGAWVRASEGAVGGTPQIIDNGAASALTLTTALAYYYHYTVSATYPSSARGVGMISSATAVANVMSEAGMLIAFLPSMAVAPTAPAALSVSYVGLTGTLTWTAPTSGTAPITYSLYRGTTPGGENAMPVSTGITGTSTTDTVPSSGTYYYYLVASNSAGTGPASNETSALASSTAILLPSLVNVSQSVVITLTNPLGNWTPGSPGAPVFTVLTVTGATLTGQQITSAGQATLTLNVSNVVGSLVILDSRNSVSYAVTIQGWLGF